MWPMHTHTTSDPDWVPLPSASIKLGQRWRHTYDDLLAGQLEGEQRAGRWFVTRESLDRLIARRARRD